MSTYCLALDPGHTTGWAAFNKEGGVITFDDVTGRQAVYDLLIAHKPEIVVMEDWITKKDVRLGGDKLETVRLIGAVEYHCHLHKIKLIEQPNTIKSIAYRWAGLTKPKNHANSHGTDAYVHGVYYLQQQGIRKPQQGRAT